MSSPEDILLGANYYWVLDLENAPDPVAENARLREIITKKAKAEKAKVSGVGTTNTEKDARSALLRALHKRMLANLGPEDANPPAPKDIWRRHYNDYKAVLKGRRAKDRRDANTLFDILGDNELSTALADKVEKELGDESLFKEIASSRRIAIREAGARDALSEKFITNCRAARRKAGKLLPYLYAYGVEDVYRLLGRITEMTLTPTSSPQDLATAIEALQAAPNRLGGDTKTKGLPLTNIKTELSHLSKPDAGTPQTEQVRTILDDLLNLERAMPFFAAVRLMKNVDILRRDHVERIVVKGAAASGLSSDRVLALLKGLMKNDGIEIGRWSLTGSFRVCAACGTTNRGSDQTCVACDADLFLVCANCEARFDNAATACPTCGTTRSDGEAGRAALAQAVTAIRVGDVARADTAIIKAAQLVPRSPQLSALSERRDALRSRAATEEAQVAAMVREGRHVAAAAVLARAPAGFSASLRKQLQKTVDESLSSAKAKTAEARTKLNAGDTAAAEKALRQALAVAADFAPASDLLDRVPPPPPTTLSVQIAGSTAVLSWAPPDTAIDGLSYIIVRSDTGPPQRPSEGEIIATTRETRFIDLTPNCGTPLSYAVFSRRGESDSQQAARQDDVCIVAPVERLKVSSDDHTIRLAWQLPRGARDAEIRRVYPDTPTKQVAAAPVLGYARTSYVDETATRGTKYRFHVTACYERHDEPDLRAAAVSELAVITDPPSAFSQLWRDDKRDEIRWRPLPQPGEKDELLLLDPGTKSVARDSIILRSDIVARALAALGNQAAVACSKLPFGRRKLQVIRTRGDRTRIGPTLMVNQVTPIESVTLDATRTGAQLSWQWPEGCSLARLRVTIDRKEPEVSVIAADGASQTAIRFIRAQPPAQVSVCLTALINEEGPESRPVKCDVRLLHQNELRYGLVARTGLLPFMRGPGTLLEIELQHPEPLPELEIRFHPEYLPGPGEGECLCVVPASRGITKRYEEDIRNALGNRQGFVGVIITDPEVRQRMTLVPHNERVS